jgi:hypothetical protein
MTKESVVRFIYESECCRNLEFTAQMAPHTRRNAYVNTAKEAAVGIGGKRSFYAGPGPYL